jgi:hypothetical protein
LNIKTTLLSSFFVITAFLLSGCDSGPITLNQMCAEQAQICTDIDSEGWCKHQRVELISRRYQSIKSPDDQDNQYRTLIAWKEFNQCIKIAANITRKTITDRTSTKAKAYITSIYEIEKLEQATLNSKYPQLLYYHWSQDGNRNKMSQLLKLDRKHQLDTTELQLMMASYYAKVDTKKEIKAQYKALKFLSPQLQHDIDNQLFASLATNFYRQKKYQQAYIWTKISEYSGLNAASSSSLIRRLTEKKTNFDKLETIAQNTYTSITSYQFITPESQF